MFGSFQIGRVFGIDVRVHWTFLALFVVLIAQDPNPLHAALYLTLLFVALFLHELGHSLTAKRFGIEVVDITFWPLGGMARMTTIPESSRIEGLVALAGPAVNFALAGLTLVALAELGFARSVLHADFGQIATGTSVPWLAYAFTLFLLVNLGMGLFNLVPAFPMDGGRVLRALIGAFVPWLRATEIAVAIGRLFAVAMIVAGIVWHRSGGVGLVFAGLFVFWAGTAELWGVRRRHARSAFDPFEAPRSSGAARTVEVAVASSKPSMRAERASGDASGARRPVSDWRGEGFGQERLSDEHIARMERFRGRLHDAGDGAE